MAALTLFLRSTASGVVSSNASVNQLSLTEGATSGGTADGTAFVPVASTNYNVGPGANVTGTPGGTITGTGKGWFYDTQPLVTFLAGTWTVNFELLRASGGAHTGHAICEIYVVTATTTTVTKVSLIGTADSGLITLTTTATRFAATFSGSSTTLAANQYLYIQVFWECTTTGTGTFSNLVDESVTASAAEIITPGTGLAVDVIDSQVPGRESPPIPFGHWKPEIVGY
jgi:hypothetical protein